MPKPILFLLAVFAATLSLSASVPGQQAAPQPATAVLSAAEKQARIQHKRVLVIFHASWCGWCKRLDAMLAQPDNARIMNAQYVIVHLDVMEHGAEKAQENPGEDRLMGRLGGEKSGLPYYVFLDDQGRKLADSNVMPAHQNIGYPGSDEEVAAFGGLLKQTAPRLADAQRTQITQYLQKNAPAR